MTEETKVKLSAVDTLRAKYADLFKKRSEIDVKLAAIVAEVHAIESLTNLTEGAAVEITVGRGDDAKAVAGVVVAVRTNKDGTKDFKVQYGTGFDANIAVVSEGKIRLPAPAPETIAG